MTNRDHSNFSSQFNPNSLPDTDSITTNNCGCTGGFSNANTYKPTYNNNNFQSNPTQNNYNTFGSSSNYSNTYGANNFNKYEPSPSFGTQNNGGFGTFGNQNSFGSYRRKEQPQFGGFGGGNYGGGFGEQGFQGDSYGPGNIGYDIGFGGAMNLGGDSYGPGFIDQGFGGGFGNEEAFGRKGHGGRRKHRQGQDLQDNFDYF